MRDSPMVVAQLSHQNDEIPYSCVSSSPDSRLVILGGQDTVRIVSLKPSGLKEVRSIHISQYFHASRPTPIQPVNSRNLFPNNASQNTSLPINVIISDVSWSICQTLDEKNHATQTGNQLSISPTRDSMTKGDHVQDFNFYKNDPFEGLFSMPGDLRMADDSLIAAAGTNGVVLIWRACDLLRGLSDAQGKNNEIFKQYYGNNQFGRVSSDQSSSIGYPEDVLVEHSKAVKVAFHPRLPGLLLTASLDGTARLWERKENIDPSENNSQAKSGGSKWKKFLGALSTAQFDDARARTFSWKVQRVFTPNLGAIRDVKWNPLKEDLFAMVTNSGYLVVYNILIPHRPSVKFVAHGTEATTLDWHPTNPYVIATGGIDKKVKVFDLKTDLSFDYIDNIDNLKFNQQTQQSSTSTINSTDRSPPKSSATTLDRSYHGLTPKLKPVRSNSTHGFTISGATASPSEGGGKKDPTSLIRPNGTSRQRKNTSEQHIHELSISSEVIKIKWRPPKRSVHPSERNHDDMIAVVTTVSRTIGGSGKIYLWSTLQPFTPFSILDGHKDKSVADFIWVDTPEIEHHQSGLKSVQSRSLHHSKGRNTILHSASSPDNDALSGTWQHILTAGKDGKCLVQSFCRGEKPIAAVPPSAFAMTELSPHQKGFGSLQLIAAHQNVPSGRENEYKLCGFRRDDVSAQAPGIFEEPCTESEKKNDNKFEWDESLDCLREQRTNLDLTFSTTDSGDLKKLMNTPETNKVGIAPEVVHISRFADSYKLKRDSTSRTKVSLCRHNSNVAKNLNCAALARMWSMLASLLEGSSRTCDGSEDLSNFNSRKGFSRSVFSFAFLPTLKKLLLERADAGDVQTCVVICEVMEVIPPQVNSVNNKALLATVVPGLDVILVRQWYISYIELLQQMYLFTHATNLIRTCNDPEISKLNQQSTTVHEACPLCFKAVQDGRRVCRSCREKIGHCFLCQLPVKGVYVWCPGCGHGGHLEHAVDWFLGVDNKLRKMCPTGCGHICNNLITMAESMVCQEIKPKSKMII